MYHATWEDVQVRFREVRTRTVGGGTVLLTMDGEYIGEYLTAEEAGGVVLALAACATCGQSIAEGARVVIESRADRAHHAACCNFCRRRGGRMNTECLRAIIDELDAERAGEGADVRRLEADLTVARNEDRHRLGLRLTAARDRRHALTVALAVLRERLERKLERQ